MGEHINMKISRADWFPAQYTSLVHLKTTNAVVKRKLTETQLQLFRNTIFGPYLDLNIIFSSGVVHEALLREVVSSVEDIITFNVRGRNVTFGKKEFLLVTGLWPDTNHVPRSATVGNRLKELYFSNIKSMTVFDLEKKCVDLDFQSDEDAVKVSLVYYAELVMLGKDKYTSIDTFLFLDVDDISHFNSMDCGTIIWERTLGGLQRALVGKAKLYWDNISTNPSYIIKWTFPRFPLALQVWLYETLSIMDGVAATKSNRTTIPRMTRWTCWDLCPKTRRL